MTFSTQTLSSISIADRWASVRAHFADAYAKRKVYNETLYELSNLSDRELNDIGANRSVIKNIALKSAGYI